MNEISPQIQPQQLLHNCPLCGGQVYHKEDHPTEICPFCVKAAVNDYGMPIDILSSGYWERGFEVRLRGNDNENYRSDNPICYVFGKQCSISRYFSHVVVQVM